MVVASYTRHDIGEDEGISVCFERHDSGLLSILLESDTVTLDETAAGAIAQFIEFDCSDPQYMLEFAWRFFPKTFEELKNNFSQHMNKFLESIDKD